jgi:(2Fe-2S) ferredoxin
MSPLTLKDFQESANSKNASIDNFIKVGLSTCGIAAGADTVFKILQKELAKKEFKIPVLRCGCAGMCFAEPLVEVKMEGMPHVLYGHVDEEIALKIVRKHILGKQILNDYIFSIKDD